MPRWACSSRAATRGGSGGEWAVPRRRLTDRTAAGAERIRSSIEKHPFPHRQSQPLGRVTVSIGVATYPEDAGAGDKLVEAADRFLYQAKADGRNRVRGSDLPLEVARTP